MAVGVAEGGAFTVLNEPLYLIGRCEDVKPRPPLQDQI